MSKYLLEVGCEELPYKFIPSAIQQLKNGFETFLNNNKVEFENVNVYATPRRLAVIISGLEKQSKDEEKIVKGPIKKVAYDENGNLTKAGEGFCKKNGINPTDLYIENDYIHAKIIIKGKSIVELLKDNVPTIVLKLQGSHFMRWAENEVKFSRPIRWIVSILDNEEVKIKIIDRESSNASRGHRFAAEKDAVITSPDDYIEIMRKHNVIVDYVEDIKGITFQKGMGSMYDKAQRLVKLSKLMIGNNSTVERTALLAKADLATKLVFEFTELQGFIGADYARVSKEPENVCEGIKEHYFPLNADGEIAKTLEGQIVGIADKMDNICAVFAEGKKPTGSSDPLGVRRAALGIIRTILANDLKIDLATLVNEALLLLPISTEGEGFVNKLKKAAGSCVSRVSGKITDEIYDFFIQRLIIFLSEKYPKNVLEACAANKNPLVDLTDYIKRVEVVAKLNSPALLESANRVLRMLKEDSNKQVNKSLFKEPAEGMLLSQIETVSENLSYDAYLKQLEEINPSVEKFFNDVLVMDKDENVKENRLALLTLLKSKYAYLADFSKL